MLVSFILYEHKKKKITSFCYIKLLVIFVLFLSTCGTRSPELKREVERDSLLRQKPVDHYYINTCNYIYIIAINHVCELYMMT